MTTITDVRLSDAQLSEIHARLRVPLNDEGLRAWYPSDVSLLVREVLTQRRIIAEALDVCRDNPALEDDTVDLVRACKAIRDRWADIKGGVYAKAEMKRLREQNDERDLALRRVEQHLTEAMSRNDGLQAENDQLRAQIVDTISDAKQGVMQLQAEHAAMVARVEGLLLQTAAALR
jgi:regulator of replication initiation timing